MNDKSPEEQWKVLKSMVIFEINNIDDQIPFLNSLPFWYEEMITIKDKLLGDTI